MGGLLIGLSTFQAEFDFGVPQFRMVFQPMLIAFAAGIALIAARIWIGRGGALGAVLLLLRRPRRVALIVGPVFGEIDAGDAALPRRGAVRRGRRAASRPPAAALGAVAGVLIGTVGFAAEWGWTHVVFRCRGRRHAARGR